MINVKRYQSDRLSSYRTRHVFLHYGEFHTVEEFIQYRQWAIENSKSLYILGNGSNTLFIRRNIESLVLQNCLDSWMKDLGDGRIEASSSLPIIKIMKYCEENSLDSFYFLASVPAQVGGALAMNAGGGTGLTIFDFVESITYFENGNLMTIAVEKVARGHRHTMFTGIHDRLIVSAVFKFTPKKHDESEILKRVNWSRTHQDLSSPNCGSVFKVYHKPIFRYIGLLFRYGIYIPGFRTQFSRKVMNWIISKNKSSWAIVFLIRMVQGAHRVLGKKAILEIIEVK